MTIRIVHNHADGTLVYGTERGDGVWEIAKAHRFAYFPSMSMIGLRQSRDKLAKRWQIESLATALREAGFEVEIEIDDTPRDRQEVKADEAERLDARYERLSNRAARHSQEAHARANAADQISQRFAGGQPILVGHHSERGARRDQAKMDNHMRKSVEAQNEAERAAAAASVVGTQAAYRDRPAVITRRIAKNEAEIRKIQHLIDGTRPANDWRGAYYAPESKPATGGYLERLNARKAFYEHQIADDREALAEHVAAGWVQHSRETIHKGDKIVSTRWWADGGTVTRVNPKTVTVDTGATERWRQYGKIPYEEIKAVQCPHENKTVTQKKFGPLSTRAAVTVADAKPVEVEPVVEVSAGFECFVSPPDVVAAIMDGGRSRAEFGPGITVLEPSAGTGAIARAAAETGATVDVIEFNAQLYVNLRESGIYRNVQCADFLAVEPTERYDAVLMNPPFSRGQDVYHVTHATRFVKPFGIVVAVMSAGVEFRSDKRTETFRKMVADRGGWFEKLPAGAFDQSGTGVATVLAVIPGTEAE